MNEEAVPAGFRSLPPRLTSTAELRRIPMVPFSVPMSSAAVHRDGQTDIQQHVDTQRSVRAQVTVFL